MEKVSDLAIAVYLRLCRFRAVEDAWDDRDRVAHCFRCRREIALKQVYLRLIYGEQGWGRYCSTRCIMEYAAEALSQLGPEVIDALENAQVTDIHRLVPIVPLGGMVGTDEQGDEIKKGSSGTRKIA